MTAHPVDVYVGNKLRSRRIMLGLSQEFVGRAIGVSFQQIQKYERGINRMGSSRLYDFSKILKTSISYFFEGYEYGDSDGPGYIAGLADEADKFEQEAMASRETIELIRAYYSIRDEKTRKRFLELIKSVAESEHADIDVLAGKAADAPEEA